MPQIADIFGYKIFFWSNEGYPVEPIHIHVSKTPSKNATKIWIRSDGSLELAHNKSQIKAKDLSRIMKVVEDFSDKIILKWEEVFGIKPDFIDVEDLSEDDMTL